MYLVVCFITHAEKERKLDFPPHFKKGGDLSVGENGRFLGMTYGLFTTTDFVTSHSLYPVVGMDSKNVVHVNYGGIGRPFHFNLASYCHRQQQQIVPAKSRIQRKYRFSKQGPRKLAI